MKTVNGNTSMRSISLGDMELVTHLHSDGTHSFGLIRYGRNGDRYLNLSFHFTGDDFESLIDLLQQTRAEAKQRDEKAQENASVSPKVS